MRRALPQMRCYAETERSTTILLESELPVSLGGKGIRPTPFQYFLFGAAASYLSAFMLLASEKKMSLKKIVLEVSTELDYLRMLKPREGGKGSMREVEFRLSVKG